MRRTQDNEAASATADKDAPRAGHVEKKNGKEVEAVAPAEVAAVVTPAVAPTASLYVREQVTPRHTIHLNFVAMSLLVLALTVFLLREFSSFLAAAMMAAFLLYVIIPIHLWLVRRHIPAFLSYTLITLVIVAAIGGAGYLLFQNMRQLSADAPTLQKKMNGIMDYVSTSMSPAPTGESTANPVPASQNLEPKANPTAVGAAEAKAKAASSTQAKEFGNVVRQNQVMDQTLRWLEALFGTVFGVVTQVGLILVFLIFLLFERAQIPRRVERAFGKERADKYLRALNGINTAISRYLGVKAFCCFLLGVTFVIVLWSFGVETPFLWGALAFLLNFIPYVGSMVAATVPALFAYVQTDDAVQALIILLILHTLTGLIAGLLETFMLGGSLRLSPFVLMIALSFWGVLWGIFGMILAAPLMVVVQIIFENIPQTKFLAVLMSDAPRRPKPAST